MKYAAAVVIGILTPDVWTLMRAWKQRTVYRFKARQAARLMATKHMAMVARAVYSGSTDAYTLIEDLPRHDNSTHVKW